MRLLSCFFWVLLWLLAGTAHAQNTCVTLPQPACTFLAIDVATGQQVEAFCVGRAVRFEQCPGRNVQLTLLRYGALAGTGTTFPGCAPTGTLGYEYTPTPADVGTVTVSELANVVGNSTYYIRTFRVYDTPAPQFQLAPCPSGSVLVTVTDATYDRYTVQAGSGAPQAIARNQATAVSAPPGAAITVTGHYAANGVCEKSFTQRIAALPAPQAPALTRLTLDAAGPGATATFETGSLPAFYTYTLQIADGRAPGGFRDVADLSNSSSSSFRLPGAAAGCYRLLRSDACNTGTAASPLICTLSLAGRSAQNRNQLLLTDAGAGNTYSMTRNDQPLASFNVISGGLEDPTVECGSTYTYVVSATQPGGGVAVSNAVAVTTQSALPPPAPRLMASFNLRDVVELTPLLAPGTALGPGATLRYRRTAGAAAPADFGTAATLRAQRDSTSLAELRAQPPCYSVRVVDVCGNASAESAAGCPALLSASAADPSGATAALTWTAFTGPDPGVPARYALQRLAPDGTVLSTVAVSGNAYTDLTPPTDQQRLRYRLQISGAGLPVGTFSYSNLASLTRPLALTIPTAFTPNGDGLNDVLEVKGRYLRDFTFVIVDRNGQEVFRGRQRGDVWDGTIRGHAPVPGAYAWRFQQAGEDGKPFTATGSVTILK